MPTRDKEVCLVVAVYNDLDGMDEVKTFTCCTAAKVYIDFLYDKKHAQGIKGLTRQERADQAFAEKNLV